MTIQKRGNNSGKENNPSEQKIDGEAMIEEKSSFGEHCLIKRLKAGDEAAFARLVEQYHSTLLLLARKYVRSQCSAEEVVQETWMGVLQGLASFEERSSLKTWIFRILTNNAHTRALRDQRVVPFSSLTERCGEWDAYMDELERFEGVKQPFPGSWSSLAEDKQETPEENLLSSETHAHIAGTLAELPISQRTVMTLRDIEGWRPEEICTKLGISMGNQRVLLHRARTKVRRVLEQYFDET